MPSMSLATSHDVFDAAIHLPLGAALVVHDFTWRNYEQLLEAIGDRPGFRVSYNGGKLEIVSPSPKHDKYSRVTDLFVAAFCEVRQIDFQVFGSATWSSKSLNKGVEADACYYVRNAGRVIGAKGINLETHGPPDIAVEIDLTDSSLSKISIYADISVPEVWRYDGRAFTFYSLQDGKYSTIPSSFQLPGLTGGMLLKAIEECDAHGPIAAIKRFRRRLRGNK